MDINNTSCSLNIYSNNDYIIANKYEFLNKCCDKINDILGEDFELILINNKEELYDNKILKYKFINISEVKNSEKSNYINNKIELLKNNNFIEIEDLKIAGIGRFINIGIKTIYDYEKEKNFIDGFSAAQNQGKT